MLTRKKGGCRTAAALVFYLITISNPAALMAFPLRHLDDWIYVSVAAGSFLQYLN